VKSTHFYNLNIYLFVLEDVFPINQTDFEMC